MSQQQNTSRLTWQGQTQRSVALAGLVATMLTLSSDVYARGTTEVVIPAAASAAIYEDPRSPPANGGGEGMFIGRVRERANATLRRSLLRFDVAANVPAGATIESAELELTVTKVPEDPGGLTTRLFRVTTPWNEGPTIAFGAGGAGATAVDGDVTWRNTRVPSDFWTIEGGDFDATLRGSVLMIDEGTYAISSSARGVNTMVGDIQDWLDNPGSNNGWILRGVEDFGVVSAKRLGSRHSPDAAPMLRIVFSGGSAEEMEEIPLAGTLGLALMAGLCVLVGWRVLRLS